MPPRKTANRRRKSYQKGGFQKTRNTRNTRKHMKPSITVGLIYANWCGHCQALKPEWKNMKKELRGTDCQYLEIEDSDHHKDRKIAHVNSRLKTGKLAIEGYPTVFRIKNGVLEYYQGTRAASAMAQWFKGGSVKQEQEPGQEQGMMQRLFGGKKQKGGDCGCGQKSIFGGFAEPSGTFGSNLDRSKIGLERSGVAKPRSSRDEVRADERSSLKSPEDGN